jgi:transposase-like protein
MLKRQEKYLQQLKEILTKKSNRMVCYKCLGNVKLQDNLKTVRCTTSKCRAISPVSKYAFYTNTKLKLEDLLLLIGFILTKTRFKSINIAMDVTRQTVSSLKKNIKFLLEEDFKKQDIVLGGKDVVVEIDESKFGRRKYHKGRKVEGVWVLGMVEKTPERKIVCLPVDKRDGATLIPLIKKYVHPESIIHTDKWGGYIKLSELEYQHFSVNHSKNFVDPITKAHTNTIEGNWSGLKENISKRRRTKKNITLDLLIFMLERKNITELVSYLLNLL